MSKYLVLMWIENEYGKPGTEIGATDKYGEAKRIALSHRSELKSGFISIRK